MARAGRHLFCAVEIYTNQAGMTSLDIVADRAFLFYQPESILLQQSHEFSELHLLAA